MVKCRIETGSGLIMSALDNLFTSGTEGLNTGPLS